MHEISRRDFLRVSALAAVGTAIGACASIPEPTPLPPLAPFTQPDTPARVAAIRGTDLYTMTREALEALGGIQKIVNPGETVFIKPNMVTLPWARERNAFALGECAKPEIVIATAEECLRTGAAEVIIGDGSQMPRFDWKQATTLDGETNLADAAARLTAKYAGKARVACLEVDSPDWIEVPTGISLGKVAISSLVTQADRVISIPVLKTHRWAGLTLSLKNFVGITPLKRYGWKNAPNYDRIDLHKNDLAPEAFAQLYIDLADAVRADLAIIDASIGVEGDGPTTGDGIGAPANMKDRLGSWLILASTDLVAADATAARVINHDKSYADRFLTMAQARGLGVMHEDAIELIGERLDDLRVKWKPAKLAVG